jgi:hypothetical protein
MSCWCPASAAARSGWCGWNSEAGRLWKWRRRNLCSASGRQPNQTHAIHQVIPFEGHRMLKAALSGREERFLGNSGASSGVIKVPLLQNAQRIYFLFAHIKKIRSPAIKSPRSGRGGGGKPCGGRLGSAGPFRPAAGGIGHPGFFQAPLEFRNPPVGQVG